MKSCPTRGGAVFDAVVAYLHSPPANLSPVPKHAEKIDIIFTGKFQQGDEPSYPTAVIIFIFGLTLYNYIYILLYF
jgi:hypothetical protein